MRAAPRRRLRKALLLAVVSACAAVAALPSWAWAQAANDPDSFLYANPINQPGSVLPGTYGPVGGSTIGAGLQGDLFSPPYSGGLGENFSCTANGNEQFYGATEWWRFYPNHDGAVAARVDGSGFRPVVAIVPVDGNVNPLYDYLACLDGNASTGVAILYYPYYVRAGVGYWLQVGAASDSSGVPSQTGAYTLRFAYDPDTDGDTLLDSGDQCPNEAGSPSLGGCPDSDNDGIRNGDDRCPTQPGPAGFHGCPDSDGDGIADPDDRCVGSKGPSSHQGCPDSDGDGRADVDDACPHEDASARDKNKDGCLDTLLLHKQANVSLDVGAWTFGIVLHKLSVTKVPKGGQVVVTCKRPNGRKCGGVRVRKADVSGVASILSRLGGKSAGVQAHAARNIVVRSLKNKRLPYGTRITIRVTARKATGKYIKLTVVRGGSRIHRVDRCMNVGSKKLRKKGCK